MLLVGYNEGSLLGGTTAVGGFVGVKLMQEQLRRIAFESGKSTIDPAKYDGTMTLGTIIALATAAPLIGKTIHPTIGDALRVVDLIKAPIKLVPYGGTVIDLVLSPWIIDEIYDAILGIIRLVPGGGSVASGIDGAVKAVKTALATAAAPIGAALMFFKPKASGFSDFGDSFGSLGATMTIPVKQLVAATTAPLFVQVAMPVPNTNTSTTAPNPPPGFTWVDATATVAGHWERLRAGQTTGNPSPFPGGVTLTSCDHRAGTAQDSMNPSCASGGVTVTPGGNVRPAELPPPLHGAPGVVRDHRDWPKGKKIIATDWGRVRTYQGHAPKANLAPADLREWEAHKNQGVTPDLSVRRGAIAFKTFDSQYVSVARMGAFWDERTETLTIKVVPTPESSSYPWDYVVDAVVDAADAIADIAQDTWNFIADSADDVYNAVKKYGCMIVNNDIVVALAATGAGIVASPAASAAVVSGAAAGRGACAAMEIAEALYAIYKLLSMDFPKPPPLDTATPPAPPPPPIVGTLITNLHVVMPLTPPVVPLAKSRYPKGTITAFDVKLQRYRIAIPIGTQLPTQLQDATSAMLGATAATHFEVAQSESAPAQVSVVPLTPFEKQTGTLPLYKQPLFWGAIGTGVVVVGGGGYALYRRRRRLTSP